MPQAVQVILGLSAAGTLRQAIHPYRDELLVTDDILSCGPLPPFQSLEAWARLRTAYWDSVAQDNDGRRLSPRNSPIPDRDQNRVTQAIL
jgi:hypothetical protein